jgi:hypothetical protein
MAPDQAGEMAHQVHFRFCSDEIERHFRVRGLLAGYYRPLGVSRFRPSAKLFGGHSPKFVDHINRRNFLSIRKNGTGGGRLILVAVF